MSDILVGVYGASGFGREILPLVREQYSKSGREARVVFIDDNDELTCMNSHSVLAYESFLADSAPVKAVTVAIANSRVREDIFSKLTKDDIKILNIKAPNVIVMDEVTIGNGSILSPFVTLTSNICIGVGFHANIYSYVGHDCIIGDFVTFAPGVKCNGNVEIGDYAYIGTGAIIKQGRQGKPLKIGARAIVGMGAVVTKNVSAGETVIGNPAKPLSKSALRG